MYQITGSNGKSISMILSSLCFNIVCKLKKSKCACVSSVFHSSNSSPASYFCAQPACSCGFLSELAAQIYILSCPYQGYILGFAWSSFRSKLPIVSRSIMSAGNEFHMFADLWTNTTFLVFIRVYICTIYSYSRYTI